MSEPNNVNRNFVREWIQYAEENGNDDFFHFFCYFLSINYLFDNYNETHKERFNPQERVSERKALTLFLENCIPNLIQEDGFALPSAIPTLRNPVKVDRPFQGQVLTSKTDPRTNREYPPIYFRGVKYYSEKEDTYLLYCFKNLRDSMRKGNDSLAALWEAILIFHRIYQVRCNLFHGGKSSARKKDRDLVHESALVMKCFLHSYLKVYQYESTTDLHFSDDSPTENHPSFGEV